MVGQTLLYRRIVPLPAIFAVLIYAALPAPGQITTRPVTSNASSQPASREIEALVAQLGDRNFERRELAQVRLGELGETALPSLLAHLTDPDPEIARRVIELLPIPTDPARRVEVVMKLLATADREHLRKAVVILFQDPGAVDLAFRTAMADQTGLTAAMAAPILEQLDSWRSQDGRYRKNVSRNAVRNPEGVARLSRLHADTPAYLAEAAYWLALSARDEYMEHATSQPARTTTAPAASQP